MPIGVSRAPYLRFEKAGDRHGGEIVDFRIVQKSDFDSNRPLYFERGEGGAGKTFSPYSPDGTPNQPICQWEITVDTGVEDANGDTERRIFVDPRTGKRGTPLEGKRGQDAVNLALKKAKAHRVGLELGGKLFITYEGKVREGKGKPETTTWSAEYEPPVDGPGSGTPVSEDIHLIGGGIFNPSEQRLRAAADRSAAGDRSYNGPQTSHEAQRSAGLGVRDTDVSPAQDMEPPF